MVSIVKDTLIDAPPEDVWAALRDFGAVHERLAPGFVVDSQLVGDDVRVVTFFSGATAHERLLGIDDEHRRLAYSVVEGPLGFAHHSAAAQVEAASDGQSRFVWTADVLPDSVGDRVDSLMSMGIDAIKTALESGRATERSPV
jgi:carbon monoxide dehydrogenase subunit G